MQFLNVTNKCSFFKSLLFSIKFLSKKNLIKQSDLKKTLDINFTERKYLKLNSF
jgi:hypothetical protein